MMRAKPQGSRNLRAGTERRATARLVQVLFPGARIAAVGPSSLLGSLNPRDVLLGRPTAIFPRGLSTGFGESREFSRNKPTPPWADHFE